METFLGNTPFVWSVGLWFIFTRLLEKRKLSQTSPIDIISLKQRNLNSLICWLDLFGFVGLDSITCFAGCLGWSGWSVGWCTLIFHGHGQKWRHNLSCVLSGCCRHTACPLLIAGRCDGPASSVTPRLRGRAYHVWSIFSTVQFSSVAITTFSLWTAVIRPIVTAFPNARIPATWD